MAMIKYIGVVSPYTDELAGTAIWRTGQTRSIPIDDARVLLGYPGLFINAPTNYVGLTFGGSRIYKPNGIRGALNKIRNAGNAQCTIGVLGNSIAAGAYANNAATNDDVGPDASWKNISFTGIVRNAFADIFGPADCCLIHPAELFSSNFLIYGSAVLAGPNNTVGVSGYRIDIPANASGSANKVAVVVRGNVLRVWAMALASGVPAQYSLNGGAAWAQVSPDVSVLGDGGTQYLQRYTIPLTGSGAQAVQIASVAAGAIYFYAVCGYYNTGSGVAVHRLAKSGELSVSLLAKALDGTDTAGPVWRTSLTDPQKLQQTRSITKQLGLDLAVLCVDANDMTSGYSTYAYTLADVKRHLKNVCVQLVADGIPVLIFNGPRRDPASNAVGIPYTQDQVWSAYMEICDEMDGVSCLNAGAEWHDYAAWNNSLMAQDVVHPKSDGHAWLGNFLAGEILASCGLR